MKLAKLAIAAFISLSPLTLLASEAKALDKVKISSRTNCSADVWYGSDVLISLSAGQILTITAWGEVPSKHGIGILEFKDSKGRVFKPFRKINGKYGYIKEAQFNIPYTDNYVMKLSAPGHGIPARFCVS